MKYLKNSSLFKRSKQSFINKIINEEVTKSLRYGLKIRKEDIEKEKNIITTIFCRKHGFEDEKQGNLFFHVAEIIEKHRPKAFFLENVKNLLRNFRCKKNDNPDF